MPLVLREGGKKSQKENMEKVRGVDSCFLFFFSGGEFGLVNWEKDESRGSPSGGGQALGHKTSVSGMQGWGGILRISFPWQR